MRCSTDRILGLTVEGLKLKRVKGREMFRGIIVYRGRLRLLNIRLILGITALLMILLE